VNLAGQLSQRLITKKFLLFIVVVLALIPYVSFIATGPVRNSIDNAEHWVNLTNAMFIDGQSFIFSYGPLFWLVGGVVEHYNIWTYYLTIIFSLLFYATVVWSILVLTYKSRGYFFLALTVICFFSLYYIKVFLFIWPLLFLFYHQYTSHKQFFINARLCLLLGAMAGILLYVRFFYGLIAVAVLGGYLAIQFLKGMSFKEVVSFILAFAISSFITGMVIYGDVSLVARYFIINMQLSYGNAVDMTLDIKNYRFVFVCSFIVLGCFIAYGLGKQRLFLLPLIATWLLLFKLGYGRADHYITYFVVPCAFIMLLISFDKGYFTKVIFLVSFFSLYYLGTHPAYLNSPRLGLAFTTFNIPSVNNPFRLPFNKQVAYEDRMSQNYEQYKLDAQFIDSIAKNTVDIYPYNNEYIYANHLNYKPRPLFQNYMTLTPKLDQANADYFNSGVRPQKVIWNSGLACGDADCNSFIGIDNKYILNEDPLTSMALLENYLITGFTHGRKNEPMLLLSQREKALPANFKVKKIERMKFGEWYPLPDGKSNIVKIFPDFHITMTGRVKNLFFRGDVVRINYKLKSGVLKQYRLSIINSRSGVWASPLLDGFDINGFTGEDVAEVMFETDSSYYFEPEFDAKMVVAESPLLKYHRKKIKYNQPVILPSFVKVKDIDCEASIDQKNEPVLYEEGRTPLFVKGWLAKSTVQGTIFDESYITMIDKNKRIFYFSTSEVKRGDLISVFGKPTLENAGYASNVDTSAFHGEYIVGLSGRTGNDVFVCKNMQFPLTLR
jgi:hypothetical protein